MSERRLWARPAGDTPPRTRGHIEVGYRPEVPVEDGTGTAAVSPAASTLRDEMAVSGQRLLAASGETPMAAHSRGSTW